jgi:SAM-dependent methyltransferase
MPAMKFNSPLRRWDVLASLIEANNFGTFVEVGCKEGRLTGALLKQFPALKVVAIDPWRPFPDRSGEGAETYEDWDFGKIEREFWQNVEGHMGRLEMLRSTSLEAAAKLADQKFDLVFLDAGHDHQSVLEDIDAWWPLVRDGGFLCGHDYQHKFPGVMRAVAARFPLMRVGVMPDSVWSVMRAEDLA